jgi:PncC family amidohydrolase
MAADQTAHRLLDLLVQRGETLATAESLTGGWLGELITTVPGSSSAYVGGVISYATEVKHDLLGVSRRTLRNHGVISAECAVEMAEGAVKATGSDWAVSTTGVAGPDRQEEKPVGTVYVAVAGPSGSASRALHLEGDRESIRRQTCEEALMLTIETINQPAGQADD